MLDDSLVILDFDVLMGSRSRSKLFSNFDEDTLVRAGLSQAQLAEDSDDDQGPGIVLFLCFLLFFEAFLLY